MNAEIYSRDNCPYCVRAKNLMDHRGVQYREIPVNEFSKPDLLQRVASAANPSQHPWLYSQGVYVGPTTVPQIWLDDEYIGGYTELNAKFG